MPDFSGSSVGLQADQDPRHGEKPLVTGPIMKKRWSRTGLALAGTAGSRCPARERSEESVLVCWRPICPRQQRTDMSRPPALTCRGSGGTSATAQAPEEQERSQSEHLTKSPRMLTSAGRNRSDHHTRRARRVKTTPERSEQDARRDNAAPSLSPGTFPTGQPLRSKECPVGPVWIVRLEGNDVVLTTQDALRQP